MAHHTASNPSREELIRLNRTFAEVFQAGDVSRIDELVAPDFVDHDPTPGTTPDRQGLKDWLAASRAAFSNLRFTVEDEIVEGDKIVARGTISGTHTGEWNGIPPSNKDISVQTIDVIRVRDGKAVEHWGVFDALGMLQQLGIVEAPGTPALATAR